MMNINDSVTRRFNYVVTVQKHVIQCLPNNAASDIETCISLRAFEFYMQMAFIVWFNDVKVTFWRK